MPRITIDGRQIEVPPGTMVIQAAEKMGIFVPRYCYHPGLSVAGNCRICLVEVEKNPKLQIACNTPVADGMVVHTESPRVKEGQAAVMEFLLANHPLDCPVCDQSGECDLQNYYLQYGLYDSRFNEQKVKKPKAVPIGRHVMLDAERCILCSRCVRFTDEISKTGELGIFNRGDRAEIGLYPGKTLDNNYSGNVIDICPVGALTEREFRFKCRVWYLSTAPSVCNGCSQGCNVDVHYVTDRPHLANGDRVMRIKPRYNAEVNQWWICDEGRFGFEFVDRGRLRKVLHNGRESAWETALTDLAGWLARIKADGKQAQTGVLASAQLTVEELYLIRLLFKEALGVEKLTVQLPEKPGSSDAFLLKADKNPNRAGAALVGLTAGGPTAGEEIIKQALDGTIKCLWVFGHDLVSMFNEGTVSQLKEKLELFVFQGPNENGTSVHAHWVLPTAVHLEKDGVFVNANGRAQRVRKAFEPFPNVAADWEVLLALFRRLEIPLAAKTPESIFASMEEKIPAFTGLTYKELGLQGVQLKAAAKERSREEVAR